MATICQKHGPSPRRSARGARSADRGRFGFNLGGLTRYLGDPRSRYAVFGPLITWDIVYPGRVFVIPLRLRCAAAVAIGPPAAAAATVNWRSNVVPVDLTARLRSNIFRQLASDRGGSVQIGAVRSRSAALSSTSLSIAGYLGTRSTRSNLEPRTTNPKFH